MKQFVIEAMTAKYKNEKFNRSNFSLWKLKKKAILKKDNCLEAISKRPSDVKNDK